jgi:hypothetical protein
MLNYRSQKIKFFEEISEQFKQSGWKTSPNSPTNLALSGYGIEDRRNNWVFYLTPFIAFLGIIGFPINYLIITTVLQKVDAQLFLNEYDEVELSGYIGKRSIKRTILGKQQIPKILMLNKKALLAFFFLVSLPTTFIAIGILL